LIELTRIGTIKRCHEGPGVAVHTCSPNYLLSID
jgi:hypothetical protein